MPPALRWSIVGAGSLILVVLIVCFGVAASVGDPQVPMAGNRPPLLTQAANGNQRFTFAVLGDTQKGLANFDRLLEEVMKENPAFIVHTGDLVSHNDEGHYRLARHHLLKAAPQIPILIVPGNHDIKGGAGLFERDFGPLEADFGRAPAAIIILNNALGEAPDAARLEATLKKYEGRRICIFMHVPPFEAMVPQFTPKPGFEEFFRLCRVYRVAYVFSGHAHTYVRQQEDETAFLANGIGGDSNSGQFDQKVMATLVEVTPEFIREHPIEVEPHREWSIELRHFAVGHVVQAYRALPLLCWPATAGLIALLAWLIVKRPRAPAP